MNGSFHREEGLGGYRRTVRKKVNANRQERAANRARGSRGDDDGFIRVDRLVVNER